MLRIVAGVLRRRGLQGWLVGGNVRDLELGRDSPDLDIVVAGDAAVVAKEVAAALGSPWFALSERHLTYRVMGREGHVDVAAARGGGILDDLAERDFTINAMALPIDAVAPPQEGASIDGDGAAEPPRRDALIDPFGGLGHLHQKRLVAVSDRVFTDDPLRLMRAARFCHLLGFTLDPGLEVSIRRQARELSRAAAERVTAEMALMLAGGRAVDAARLWQDLGLLEVVLPEIAATHPEGLGPTLALLERLDDLLARPLVWFPATAEMLAARLDRPMDGAVSRPAAMRLAGLLHGLEEGETEGVGRRLKLSGDLISFLRTASRCLSGAATGRPHIDGAAPMPPQGRGEAQTPPPRGRTISRPEVLFLWGAAPFEPEVIVLAAATGVGSMLPGAGGRMIALWAERAVNGVPRLPLDGDLLMSELGLEAGPQVGRALREVRLAWEAGEATTLTGLLEVARSALETAECRS